ncbi:MAG: hypothetical protein AAF555_11430 [Verrucomicrobiota bacterium]
MKACLFSTLLALGLSCSAPLAHSAALVLNDLSGNVQFDGWDNLGAVTGFGFFDVGPGSPADGNPWPSPMDSFASGSGDGTLQRTAGTHYSASGSLYSFAGPSSFRLGDSTALANLATVVFTVANWFGSSPTSDPVLNFNGGSQELDPDSTFTSPFGAVSFGGPVPVTARTYQWDLTGLGTEVTEFGIDWTQGSSAGITYLQLEQSDVFTVASATVVPEPSAALLALLGLPFALRRRRA